jgi:hypothetical protein
MRAVVFTIANDGYYKISSPNIYQVPYSNNSDVLMFVPAETSGRACFSGVHIFFETQSLRYITGLDVHLLGI